MDAGISVIAIGLFVAIVGSFYAAPAPAVGGMEFLEFLRTVLAICGILVGAATVYLRLYIGSRLAEAKENINQQLLKTRDEIILAMKQDYANKMLYDEKLVNLERRMASFSDRLNSHEVTLSSIQQVMIMKKVE